jgi:uncharacterized protein (TIGR02996 family)
MSTVSGLRQAVLWAGEDRLPWLVMADWFEERGYPEDAQRLREGRQGEDPFGLLSADAWCETVAHDGTLYHRELEFDPAERWGPLTDRGLERLATVRAPTLRWLDLSHNPVTDGAVLRLVRARGFRRLRVLILWGVTLGDDTCVALDCSRVTCVRKNYGYGGEDRCDDDWDDPWAEPDESGWEARRPDRDARPRHPGWSRHRWWGGYQVGQLRKRRRLAGG